ncbi:hypothetical protein CPB83DRAFT_862764 [Crepidotus variabilis]|uniref:MYND-type domain-containing protein n=1 Tax=Crepidotus variabilis TaxID=179855 RepID=A0A9P6E6F3_9AGAR|nr:hypothetical protein CPB83DRAFT_862764 [Crepidotus variabilis]
MPVCANESCNHSASLQCSICTGVFYCSKDCQVTHWPQHKAVCSVSSIRLLPSGTFMVENIDSRHPIFKKGELCPLTALYGHPILIYCPRLHSGRVEGNMANNQAAVYLRIEPSDGLAPISWQTDYLGDCLVARRDKKPISKELLETMHQYHSSLLGSDYFEKIMEGVHPPGHNINQGEFQKFYNEYWKQDGRD